MWTTPQIGTAQRRSRRLACMYMVTQLHQILLVGSWLVGAQSSGHGHVKQGWKDSTQGCSQEAKGAQPPPPWLWDDPCERRKLDVFPLGAVCVRACMHACVCVDACVRACVCVCACVLISDSCCRLKSPVPGCVRYHSSVTEKGEMLVGGLP